MNEGVLQARGIFYRTNTFVPGRETLVFIHGLSGSASAWKRYEDFFSPNYNVVTYDLCGHGKSTKPSKYARYALSEHARDLELLLAHLGIASCNIIAHSYGTMVALTFLRTHHARVRRAVLLSPNVSNAVSLHTRLARPLFALAAAVMRLLPFSRGPGSHIDYDLFPDTTDWSIGILKANLKNTSLRVYVFFSLQGYSYDARPYLSSISTPTLLMHGTRDTLFPIAHSYLLERALPHAQLIILKDMDHILVLNRFNDVSSAIAHFIPA